MLTVVCFLIGQVDSSIVSIDTLKSCVVALVDTSRSATCLYCFCGIFHCSVAIDADSDVIAGRTNEICILALCLFKHKMVSCSYIIMAVGFNAFDCVVSIKAELFQNLFVDCIVERHEFFLGEKSFWALIFELSVPGMRSNFLKSVSLRRIYFQNFREEMRAVRRKKLWYFVIACQYFFVQIRCFWVVKR